MTNSTFLNLNKHDFLKGLIVAVITAILTVVYNMLQNGQSIDWQLVGTTGATAMIGYLLKNLSSNSDGAIAKKEIKKDVS